MLAALQCIALSLQALPLLKLPGSERLVMLEAVGAAVRGCAAIEGLILTGFHEASPFQQETESRATVSDSLPFSDRFQGAHRSGDRSVPYRRRVG